MVLGIKELHRLVKEKSLVEGLSDRELSEPEGAGFDLRVGKLHEVSGQGLLGVSERETPDMKLVAECKARETVSFLLKPHIYYTMTTIERVNLPESLLALMTPRSTLYRSGVYIFGGQVAPGYRGELSMGMYNFRKEDFVLEMGARVVHIMFFQVKGEGNLYRGQWQGGRVTTDKKETQV